MLKWNITEKDSFTVVEFAMDSPITPDLLTSIEPPKVDATKGVILSGRGPVWLYAFLAHHYHFVSFVATFDPRLGGGVVVQTHTPNYQEGQIISLD